MTPPGRRLFRLGLRGLAVVSVSLMMIPALLSAQDALDPLVPRGLLRLELLPRFSSWDSRYGFRVENGRAVEEVEPLGMDLTDSLGTSLFPGVTSMEDRLREIISDPAYQARLGATESRVSKDVTRVEIGAQLGVFDWLTVGARVPIVKTRTAIDVDFRPDTLHGDLGLNPTVGAPEAVAVYLQDLVTQASEARSRSDALCTNAPGSAGCTEAEALATRVEGFLNGIQSAYFASPFFPLQGSAVALALSARSDEVSSALQAAGLTGISTAVPFAASRLTREDFAALPASPASGLQGTPLETLDGRWTPGDVEVSVLARLLHGQVRDSAAERPRISYLLAGGVLVRLGTGIPDDPNVFLDVGSGDGQTDVEANLFGRLRLGTRFGLSADARYGVQRSLRLLRRLAPPDIVLAPYATLSAVEWTPGSYLSAVVSPRWYLRDGLALTGAYRFFHKGADAYRLLSDPRAGGPPDASALEMETESTYHELAVGLTYSTLASWRRGAASTPLEMNMRLVAPVGGSGGQTPKATRAEMAIRIFRRFWGSDPTTPPPPEPPPGS